MSTDEAIRVPQVGTDPEAFEAFYLRYVAEIQRFVARRARDPYHAADLTSDIFLRVVETAHRYQPGRGSVRAWLYGLARNVVAEDRRSRAREDRANRQLSGRRLLDEEDVARLEARLDAEARSRQVYAAMDALSEKERAVLELVALDEMAVRDAAQALGIRPVTARVRLSRARRLLRGRLDEPDPRPTGDLPTSISLEVQS